MSGSRYGRVSRVAVAVVLVGFAAGAAPGAAQGSGSLGGRARAGQPARSAIAGLRGLDLSDAQRQQIRSITQSHRSEFQALGERMQTAQARLREATTAETMNEAAIRTAAAQVAEVQADGAVLRARVHQEVWNVLTPEQQQKATARRAEREKRQQERRERIQERIKQRRANPV